MVAGATEQALIARWIAPNPYKPGPAEAWIGPYGLSVWRTIAYLELNGWDISDAAPDYEIPPEAIKAAVAYYRQHEDAIDARITINRASFSAP